MPKKQVAHFNLEQEIQVRLKPLEERLDRLHSQLTTANRLLVAAEALLKKAPALGNGPGTPPWRGWMRQWEALRNDLQAYWDSQDA